jgi:hypothetical protein
VLREVGDAAREAGLAPHRAVRSPITGSDGNVEFLVDLRIGPRDDARYEATCAAAVHDA